MRGYYLAPLTADPLPLASAGVTDLILRADTLLWEPGVTKEQVQAAGERMKEIAAGLPYHLASWCYSNINPRWNPWMMTLAEWQGVLQRLAWWKETGISGVFLDGEVYGAVAGEIGVWPETFRFEVHGAEWLSTLSGLQIGVYAPIRPILTTNIKMPLADRAEGFFQFTHAAAGSRPSTFSILWEESYAWGDAAEDLRAWNTEMAVHWLTPRGPLPVPSKRKRLATLKSHLFDVARHHGQKPRDLLPAFVPGLALTASNLAIPGWLESGVAARRKVNKDLWIYPHTDRVLEDAGVCARLRGCLAG